MQNLPKLIKCEADLRKNGETVYTGLFSDGIARVIRKSFRTYVSVAQLAPVVWYDGSAYKPEGEYLFSSKPSVALGKAQTPRLIAEVRIGVTPTPVSLEAK
jgi:hypothetical protein